VAAIDAFEASIGSILGTDALSKLGDVDVETDQLGTWVDLWSLEAPTREEKRVCSELLFGAHAPARRRLGGQLILHAAQQGATEDVVRIRALMAGEHAAIEAPSELQDVQADWRRL